MLMLTFDLDTSTFSKLPISSPYKPIERYLAAKGFTHPEGSVYIHQTLTNSDGIVLVQQMAQDLPWLSTCMRDIHLVEGLRVSVKSHLFAASTPPPL